MPVYVRKSGQWKSTDVVFARQGGAWREVKAAYVYTRNPATGTMMWLAAFNKYQEAPINVVGTNPTASGGTLQWQAPPLATKYQVTVLNKTTNQPVQLVDDGWTTQLSYTLSSLLPDTNYVCSVKAAREVVGGADLTSGESPKWTLSTGHPAVRREATGQTVLIKATRSDTWSNDRGWEQTGGDVIQGYSQYKSRNGNGSVAYANAYAQLATAINYPTTVIPAGAPNAADHVVVDDVEIERIYRKAGGPVEPTVEVRACFHDWKGDPKDRDVPSTLTSFKAPEEQSSHYNYGFGALTNWVKEWVKKTPAHNGLLIYRTGDTGNNTVGFNGYCIFRAANNTPEEWRLKLTVSWAFDYPALQAPTWTAGG